MVKLGGSVVTNKEKLKAARPFAITRLAKEIAVAREDVILVHGAGSFGHIKAKKYGLQNGYSKESQLQGVAEVQEDVRSLNLHIMQALREAGSRPVSIPPGVIVRFKGGALSSMQIEPFHEYLALHMMPVTFGDVVLDSEWRFAICSGDDLMLELSKAFSPRKCLFVADVDGIFTGDPKGRKKHTLLGKMSGKDVDKVNLAVRKGVDVTGGIEGKLTKMLKAAEFAGECWILNGLVPGRLRDALLGRRFIGTKVVS